MAYSYQSFSVGEIATSTKQQQTEDNIKDHVHGRNSVAATGISFPTTAKSAAFSPAAADAGELFYCTGTFAVTFDASSTLGNGWAITVSNISTGTITLTPNGAETISGKTSYTVSGNETVVIWCDGSNLFIIAPAPSWQLLQSPVTAAGDASIDFETGISSYKAIRIIAQEIQPASAGTALWLRLKVSGSYQTASYAWNAIVNNDTTIADPQNISDAKILLTDTMGLGLSASVASNSFEIIVSNPSNTTDYKMVRWTGSLIPNAQTNGTIVGGGYYSGTAAVTGIRIMMSSGNIDEGYFQIFGLAP